MVTILALAAAVLYGTADFLGGVASRRASVFAVLATTVPAGAAVVIVMALLGEAPGLGGLLGHGLGSPTSVGGWGAVGWAAVSGICGAVGLVAFYAGFAAAPISVVAPVAALVSTVLPVGIAVAGGERPTSRMVAGGLICLVAIVMVSMPPARQERPDSGRPRGSQAGDDPHDAASRLRGLGYGVAAGAGFGRQRRLCGLHWQIRASAPAFRRRRQRGENQADGRKRHAFDLYQVQSAAGPRPRGPGGDSEAGSLILVSQTAANQ